jgi:hypothetical protein
MPLLWSPGDKKWVIPCRRRVEKKISQAGSQGAMLVFPN